MDTNQVNFWLSINAENFAPETLPIIKSKLDQMDDTQMMYLQSTSFKKPSTIFIVALILGWERFLLDDIGLGVLKVMTAFGCGIWWLIDVISAKKRAQKYNFDQFQKATAFVVPSARPTTEKPIITENPSGSNVGTQTPQYTAPVSNNNFDEIKAKASEISQSPIVARVKNILLSPKTEWGAIDKENTPHSKVLIGYLLLLAAVPAVASLLGYIFYSIFSYMPFVYCFSLGFKVAIMLYVTVVGGVYLTALAATLFADKFSSVKDFNKSFSLAVHSWTPVCVLGILLIYPSLFTFWVWAVAGILYGLFLIYSGIKPMLKTPFEQLTPFVAICAGSLVAAFFVLIVVLSYIFLGDIYFNFLSYFSYPSYDSYFGY